MVDAIISPLLEQLVSFALEEAKEQVRLVTGVGQEVKRLISNLQAIQAVLEDAEQRQMKHDKAVTLWLDQLKDASHDMEDVLDEWITARRKLQIEGVDDDNALALARHKKKVFSFFPAAFCFRSFKQLSLRHDIAVKIKEINEKLHEIVSQKDRFKFNEMASNNLRKPERVPTISLIDEGEIFGRVDEKSELLGKLLGEISEQQNGLHIISLVGLGGIGKTALAQLACNNDKVKKFFEKVIWVCVSDTFEEIRVAKAIIEALDKSASSLGEFQSLMSHIHRSVEGKKLFLVLDDVWSGDYDKWEPFFHCLKNGHHESKILITTRDESVARKMGSTDIVLIKRLSEEECLSLFKRLAFSGRSFEDCENLEETGKKIASKCKGLPLAIKTIGNLLRSKITVEEWERILDSKMWQVDEIEKGLLAPLLLSYSYCAIFPKDYRINKEQLIALWMAQGYIKVEEGEEMEMIGEEYFNYLATRSFFQEFEKDDNTILHCKMHDIVHEFAQFLCGNECLTLEMNGREESVLIYVGEKVRHLVLSYGGASFPMSACSLSKLRTLLIINEGDYHWPFNSGILPQLFDKLTCLRAFVINSVSRSSIKEIPENIGKLIHLKYLNLSGLDIERLPESLCELYNLHKLDISECQQLRELPVGIGKLVNMRSLLNAQTRLLEYMPIGITRLTNLRTLDRFAVSGGVDDSKTSSLESLKKLQLLRECGISGLGNVSDLGEAERLELYKRSILVSLDVDFYAGDEEGRRKNEEDEQLLEALQPHVNLKQLTIGYYRGKVFPNWLISLTNLRELALFRCNNCGHLPPLGKLPL